MGGADDYLKIKYKNNAGLSIVTKFLCQMIIALVFFYLFMRSGGSSTLKFTALNIVIPLGWMFGIFILFLLVGTSNAVNITDGLDGLAGSLSLIAFLTLGIITYNTGWLEGYEEVSLFCFSISGSLIGFLLFNLNPAKVFMGDTGSLALGATLAAIAILTKHELSLAVIGGVFVIEAMSSIIQLTAIKKFKKKVFLMDIRFSIRNDSNILWSMDVRTQKRVLFNL